MEYSDSMPYTDKEHFKHYQRDYRKRNRAKVNRWRKKLYDKRRATPEALDVYRRKERIKQIHIYFGVSYEEAERLDTQHRAAQRCDLCGETATQFHIDHDHQTKQVRGILCQQCNMGLGLFGDSVSRLEDAIRYLKQRAGQVWGTVVGLQRT